jgi:predicted HicB family RNase H-like nuclease
MARRKAARPTPGPREGELKLYALLSVRLPADLAMELKRACTAQGTSVNATVIGAIREYLARERA